MSEGFCIVLSDTHSAEACLIYFQRCFSVKAVSLLQDCYCWSSLNLICWHSANLTSAQSRGRCVEFFVPLIVIIGAILTTSYLLARGQKAGVAGLAYVCAMLLISTVLLLSYSVVTASHSGLWLLLALVALAGARWILNGQAFILFAIYCRTQRLASVDRQHRMK